MNHNIGQNKRTTGGATMISAGLRDNELWEFAFPVSAGGITLTAWVFLQVVAMVKSSLCERRQRNEVYLRVFAE